MTVLSLIVIVQVGGGQWDIRSWLRLGLPLLAVFLCDFLVWKIRSQLSNELVTQAQEMTNPSLSFANVIPDLPKMSVRHFIGLLFIIPCQDGVV